MGTKKPASEDVKPSYQPTEREQTVLVNNRGRRIAQTAPRVKVVKMKGVAAPKIETDHPDQAIGAMLLMEALGTADFDFYSGIVRQLANASSLDTETDEAELNFMLSAVKGADPKDQFETMLVAQMAAVHMATMRYARRLARVDNIPQQDSAERTLNKLARTYAMQMEAFKRYRTGGEQKVTVRHVSVSEGGQAIVGNVTQAARDSAKERPANGAPALGEGRQPTKPIVGERDRVVVELRRKKKDGGRSSS
jgi:hypothetical protein